MRLGTGDDGPFSAGMALVKVNGDLRAKLRTCERYEITVSEPELTTRSSLSLDISEASR